LATSADTAALTSSVLAVTPASLAGLRFTATGPVAPATVMPVLHNMNSLDVMVQVYEIATGGTVECDVTRANPSQVTLNFATTQAQNSLRVLIIKIA
jgi:hypothetical protein